MSVLTPDRLDELRHRQGMLRARNVTDALWSRSTPLPAAQDWLVPALQSLIQLEGLPGNWDGFGSPRITQAALATSRSLVAALGELSLPRPLVFPVTGGGISIEWRSSGRELEIEILADGTARYLVSNQDQTTGQEITAEGVFPADRHEYAARLGWWLIEG